MAPITPDPNTTEWVPLWNLNGVGTQGATGPQGPPGIPGATGGIHHTQHEPGGIDALVGAAWLNLPNIFTKTQRIQMIQPSLEFVDSSQPTDAKVFRLINAGQQLFFEALTDGGADQAFMVLDRIGRLTVAAGLNTTPLNASQLLSGTIPDPRLSINVLKFPGGYPGGTDSFLRADGSFASPSASSIVKIGSWTPVIGGVPPETGPVGDEGEINQFYHFQQGIFFRIDKFVYLWSYTQFGQPPPPAPGDPPDPRNGKGTITGDVAVKGFPYTPSTSLPVSMFFAGVNSYFSNMLTPTNKLSLTFYGNSGDRFGRIKQIIQNTNPLPLHDIDLNNNSQFVFALAYLTDEPL